MVIAKQIKSMRTRRGWSQATLAKRIGVSQQTIADWENGKSQRVLSSFGKLFKLLAGGR